MAEYRLQVTAGESATPDHVYVTLFGSTGQTEPTELNRTDEGTTGTYTVKTSSSLGKLLLVQLGKDPGSVLTDDKWYCSKIVVWSPEGEVVLFPCYRWISRGDVVELRGGKAVKVFEEDQHLLINHRNKEMTARKNLYQWKIMAEGLPHICSFNDVSDLPAEVCVSKPKTRSNAAVKLKVVEQLGSAEKWENIEDLRKIFWYKTTISEYVKEHWKDDDFYGFQFLNGGNPNVIARCSELPPNFPVTDEMVKPFLEKGSSLQQEMEKGNVFLYDQKKMDGIAARVYDGERLHVTAGLCLFYLNSENKLMPVAVQLHQQPSEENPIFLPSDPETDWLLAKMFIKNADAIDHGAVHHFMNTHFLTEVFCVAALRCFPEIHPIYKLLFPHFRDTLHTNIVGRQTVLGPHGPLSISSLGYDGLTELMKRSLSELTYSALCLPENITARGLQSIPNFYYRDDGLKLWTIINSFVKAVVEYYYGSDCDVLKDSELQDWISEIFTHGFLGNKDSGFPAGFNTVEELIKFITMVIFTATAQHAAVNNGQFDYYYWVLNGSLLLHGSPPNTKGRSSMTTFLETLPNVGETAMFAVTAWVLSEKDPDMVSLGSYPEERFDEPAPKQMIEQFKEELSVLSEQITTRNSQLEVPYLYLDPPLIQNSITI